jgi:hypothetical protein
LTTVRGKAIFDHARLAAISLEQALTQFIALSLPELEDDLPAEARSAVSTLPLLSDAELWQVANGMMSEEKQTRLESLIAQSKLRALAATEQATLDDLMREAQHLMLRKAEAYRLLARRGHVVFS